MQLSDFDYHLPPELIAQEPLPLRDQAKLLFYNKGTIADHIFYELPQILPQNSFLVFNNTKVIPARLLLQKSSGAWIEIFLLEPVEPHSLVTIAMQARRRCLWECMIGNKKRFKDAIEVPITIRKEELSLKCSLVSENRVLFEWENEKVSFAEILECLGKIPLPPYIKREVSEKDKERYQTIFALKEGAVAAPTASLHFTENVFENLKNKNISYDFLTLHVGAGTFQPIKVANFQEHKIHSERLIVSLQNIENLINNVHKNIIPVGTTSMRTLESLYWFGTEIILGKSHSPILHIKQQVPYQIPVSQHPPLQEALQAIKELMQQHQINELQGSTEIYIYPSYDFKVCKGLITNFHMPQTTLILLIAAFVGNDWRKIYQHALQNNYRFLSYGDSSLLLPS
ncbi:S-adenosylmethionine:tRNA ribosyltransferase-isomerase [Raineya orbicola]|jgi:S-adenosylmethionine:tRNA ribosyltransferase-isomerase|uniref:S-adenosylmethionine:tRNA ribosyltransferase-isomerase n=1 Tax=Raineya orbicola TaxID=2016530 RepID=A0A2N3IHA4_9BACT|nr:S-adenosylmethionine:tRNA ribosyltransferase-isomerase [Raineya orbicola]PKQ69696.1 S-adenosylmethionine:tRNA-ribosyltransferase-isomerase [Raineya orbicola]